MKEASKWLDFINLQNLFYNPDRKKGNARQKLLQQFYNEATVTEEGKIYYTYDPRYKCSKI